MSDGCDKDLFLLVTFRHCLSLEPKPSSPGPWRSRVSSTSRRIASPVIITFRMASITQLVAFVSCLTTGAAVFASEDPAARRRRRRAEHVRRTRNERSGAFRVIRTGALLDFLLELFGSSMLFCLACPQGALLGQQFMKWHRIGARSLSSTIHVAAATNTDEEKKKRVWSLHPGRISRQNR